MPFELGLIDIYYSCRMFHSLKHNIGFYGQVTIIPGLITITVKKIAHVVFSVLICMNPFF